MAACITAVAQDVTVSPSKGDMIPAMSSNSQETGWASGAFAMWRHKQLPLTVTVGDESNLNGDGLLALHANNLYANQYSNNPDNAADNTYLVMLAGQVQPGYMTISLPRGMRFTRYRIVLTNNITTAGSLSAGTSANVTFAECTVSGTGGAAVWTQRTENGTYAEMSTTSASNTTEYTLERSSDDMGNILYFKLDDGGVSAYQTCAFKTIYLEFTSEAPFTVNVQPSVVKNTGVSYVQTPFFTGKQDMGYIRSLTYRNSDGTTQTRYGYYQADVKDIMANTWLYEEKAIGDDKGFPTTDIGDKTIQQVLSGGQGYFLITPSEDNNTYYVETPAEAQDQFGNNVYLNYRIVGATIHYAKTVDASEAKAAVEGGTYITYTDGSTTYYLQADGKTWSTTEKVIWHNDGGVLWTGDEDSPTYLMWATYGGSTSTNSGTTYYSSGTTFYLSTTTARSQASTFSVDNGQISASVPIYTTSGWGYNTTYDYDYYSRSLTTSTSDVSSSYYSTDYRLTFSYGYTYPSFTTEDGNTYITYTSYGTTYYLQADGRTWSATDKVVWSQDSYGDLYTGTGSDRTYLRFVSGDSYNYLTTTTSSSYATEFTVSGGKIVYTSSGGFGSSSTNYYLTTSTATISSTRRLTFTSNNYTYPAYTEVQSEEGSDAREAQTLDDYNLTVYGKDGSSSETISVTDEAEHEYQLTDLNNDAIKFSLSGAGLVRVDLQVEYLNPFVDAMQVEMECTNPDITFSSSQNFTTTDFTIGGNTATFAVPSDLASNEFKINFTNLRSDYADETYTGIGSPEHNSRYNFVKSTYYNLFNEGGSTDASFMGDNNIYNNRDEAASHDYNDKIAVSYAGSVAFKFNNADTYTSEITAQNNNRTTLKEYPFTLENYADQVNLSGASANGEFKEVTITPSTSTSASAYLFTTDETRYNIAPTTAVQHRMYAFYDMNINVDLTSYSTTATLQPVYQSSFYDSNSTGAFYGATVSTNATTGLGYTSINNAITAIKDACTTQSVDASHILYIDMATSLDGAYATSDASWNSVKENFTAPNLLVFIPKNNNVAINNFAYEETSSTTANRAFHSGANIIITDKQPFYSPYNIAMSMTNYAQYDREFTTARNGQVKYGTLILPFVLRNLSNGQPTEIGNSKVTLLQMNADNSIDDESEETPTGYFTALTGTETTANTPYAFYVESTDDDTKTFTLKQNGSNIIRTPGTLGTNGLSGDDLTISAKSSSTGTLSDGSSVSFTMAGTYAGQQVSKSSKYIFYFVTDGFYNSTKLVNHDAVNVRPFRAYFDYSEAAGAKLDFFAMAIGENPTTPTGIANIVTPEGNGIIAGKGYISITALTAGSYNIVTLAGQRVGGLNLRAGDTRTVAVPAGMYIVNGTKVIVR